MIVEWGKYKQLRNTDSCWLSSASPIRNRTERTSSATYSWNMITNWLARIGVAIFTWAQVSSFECMSHRTRFGEYDNISYGNWRLQTLKFVVSGVRVTSFSKLVPNIRLFLQYIPTSLMWLRTDWFRVTNLGIYTSSHARISWHSPPAKSEIRVDDTQTAFKQTPFR